MGNNETQSTSAPITAQDRLKTYGAAEQAMGSNNMGDSYKAPQTERLSVDYDQLQGDVTKGYTAGLDYAKGQDVKNFNNSAGAKGIWSSGLAVKGEQDINAGYAPQYAKAGADATNQRYQLQTGDIAASNANKSNIADKQYESSWRPADYKAGIWNGTGGISSSSKGGGWSI
jgi:hypothetical protein